MLNFSPGETLAFQAFKHCDFVLAEGGLGPDKEMLTSPFCRFNSL
jgi:hypothetical protein